MSILVMNKIDPKGTDILKKDGFDVTTCDYGNIHNGIVVRSAPINKLLAKRSCAIARAGAGTNNIPVDYCTENFIPVFNTPGANSTAVAELTMFALLASSRRLVDGCNVAYAMSCEYRDNDTLKSKVESSKKDFKGPELYGKTLGVIGYGQIGHKVAYLARSFGMTPVVYDPYVDNPEHSSLIEQVASLKDLLLVSDYITIHVPSNEQTFHLINKETLSLMKDEVRIVNLSRDEIVEHDVVFDDKVVSYVTDFPSVEFKFLHKVIQIPHLGASTFESEERCAVNACREISDYLRFGIIQNSINFPTTSILKNDPQKVARVCIMHKSNGPFYGHEDFSNEDTDTFKIRRGLTESFESDTEGSSYSISTKEKGEVAYTIVDISRQCFKSYQKFINFLTEKGYNFRVPDEYRIKGDFKW